MGKDVVEIHKIADMESDAWRWAEIKMELDTLGVAWTQDELTVYGEDRKDDKKAYTSLSRELGQLIKKLEKAKAKVTKLAEKK